MDNASNTPAEWLTYREAAARFGVSLRTLERLASSGRLRRRRLPHRRPAVQLEAASVALALSPEEVAS